MCRKPSHNLRGGEEENSYPPPLYIICKASIQPAAFAGTGNSSLVLQQSL